MLVKLVEIIANVCEHVKVTTSVASYIDPRIIYRFLLANDILDLANVFFQPKQMARNAWAHPSKYDYSAFKGYSLD